MATGSEIAQVPQEPTFITDVSRESLHLLYGGAFPVLFTCLRMSYVQTGYGTIRYMSLTYSHMVYGRSEVRLTRDGQRYEGRALLCHCDISKYVRGGK